MVETGEHAFILRVEDGGTCAASGRGLGRNRLRATTAGCSSLRRFLEFSGLSPVNWIMVS
jgi:hypothetical protein